MPARRSTANSCSRNCTGTSRLRASSPIGTGSGPRCARARRARARVGRLAGDRDHAALRSSRAPSQRERSRATGDSGDRARRLQPAALGGDQHGLGAVDGAELAVDVVQVRAHRARRERQLVGDLLVDLALGQPLQDAELAAGQRARDRRGAGAGWASSAVRTSRAAAPAGPSPTARAAASISAGRDAARPARSARACRRGG